MLGYGQQEGMTTGESNSSSSPSQAKLIHTFLKELPSPFREQLLVRLYGFFEGEITFWNAEGVHPEVFLLMMSRQAANAITRPMAGSLGNLIRRLTNGWLV
jgi:hypothetical protein